MKIFRSKRFVKKFLGLPTFIQNKIDKQLIYLKSDPRHPSLRAKKYDESRGVWQARVDNHFRFYFQIDADTYVIVNILSHPD